MNLKMSYLLIIFLLFFSFCKKESKVNILVVIPLTGDAASYGQVQKQGIEIALEELKMSLIKKELNIIYGDSKMDPREAINILYQESSKIDISVVLGFSTAEVLALSKACNQKKIVLLAPLASGDEITNAGPYVFRISPTDSFQGEELAIAVLEDKKEKISVLYVNDAWGKGLSDRFVSVCQSKSGEIVSIESCNPNQTDLRTQLLKIKNSEPEAVIFILHPGEIIPALKQYKELGLTAQIYGGDTFSHKSIYTDGVYLAQGVIFTLPTLPDNSIFKAFNDLYKIKFSTQADINAAAARDAIMLIWEATKQGADNGELFRKTFESFSNGFIGATGMIKWDKNGDVMSKKYGVYAVENESYKRKR